MVRALPAGTQANDQAITPVYKQSSAWHGVWCSEFRRECTGGHLNAAGLTLALKDRIRDFGSTLSCFARSWL